MQSYILAIVGIVLLTAVITIIAPSGKMGKFLKGATKLAILFIMLMPIRSLLAEESFAVSGENIAQDDEYLAYCARELAAEDAAAIMVRMEEEYGIEASVRVERNTDATFSYQKITVLISDFGISDEDEHIYMIEKIEAELEAYYNCDAEVS